MNYRLTVRQGDQIHLVHQGIMPPFDTPPRIVVWGERLFMLDLSNQRVDRLDYCEAFTWAAVS